MSAPPTTSAERRIRLAGVLVISGAIIEVVTLMIRGPLSFLAFMFVAGALITAGMVTYLFSLIGPGPRAATRSDVSKPPSAPPPQ